MENLSHSLSKRSYGGNGFGSASRKSVYDDVFGGPPKYGVPNLAPRFEDYGEIFGGFHSSRGFSIPVLDLPSVNEDELSFDVRSAWFDYSEVFGGFRDLDFAVSFEDLIQKFDSGDYSSDDAWSPDRREFFSNELDPAVGSRNTDTSFMAGDVTHFHTSYYKANQRVSGQNPIRVLGDYNSKIDCVKKIVEGKQLRKSTAFPLTSGSSTHGTDRCNLEQYKRSSFGQHEPFVTVNDINLRTKPSGIPPPSRPPPLFAVKREEPEKANSDLKDSNESALGHVEDSNSPPFYDVEVDVSSSRSASACISTLETHVKNTVETAKSKKDRVKEPVEEKEIHDCLIKPPVLNNVKIVEQKRRKTSSRANSSKEDKTQETHVIEGDRVHPPEERKEETRNTEEVPSLLNGKTRSKNTEKPTELRDVEECKLSHHSSHKSVGGFAWRQATEYFEVVEKDLPSQVFVHEEEDYIVVPNRAHDYRQQKKAGTEASNQYTVEPKAEREVHSVDGEKSKLELPQETSMSPGKMTHSGASTEISYAKCAQKKSDLDANCSKEGIGGSRMKMVKQNRDFVNFQHETFEIVDNLVKAQKNHADVQARTNLTGTAERKSTGEIVMDLHDRKANDVGHERGFETADYHKNISRHAEEILKEKLWVKLEERKKHEEQDHEGGENQEELTRFCDMKDNKSIIKEARKHVYFGDRLKEANSYQAFEHKLKRVNKGENDREEKMHTKIEVNDRNPEAILNLHKNKKQTVTHVSSFYEEKLSNDCDTRAADVITSAVSEEEWNENVFDSKYTEDSSRIISAPQGSTGRSKDVCNDELLSGQTEQIKWDRNNGIPNLDLGTCVSLKGLNLEVSDRIPEEFDVGFISVKAIPADISSGEGEKFKIDVKNSDQNLDRKRSNFLVEEEESGKTRTEFQLEKIENPMEDVTKSSCSNQPFNDSHECGIGIGSSLTGCEMEIPPMKIDPRNVKVDHHEEHTEKKVKNDVKFIVNKVTADDEPKLAQTSVYLAEDEKKLGITSSIMMVGTRSAPNAGQRCARKNEERKERNENESLAFEESKTGSRLQKERELENEQLKKFEEEREREREREKDRMAFDRGTLRNHGKPSAENRVRAERAPSEGAAPEVRERAVSARERLEKDPMEARERYLADKASMEARLKVERAAVEKATAEARQRAFAKTMNEKASSEVPETVERSVSDKFSSSSTVADRRPSSLSEHQKGPPKGAGPSSMLHYSYSSVGVEGESPQRYRARLERYRRTADRAEKALAEKNMRDLLAQKEQAERSRLAESLDVEVKRWSNGKEGNLRALLSTLQYILGPESGWQPVPLTEVITSAAVKKAYRKATLCVHPDKLQQRGASIQQKYTCEKVFDLLKEAWGKFTSEER